MCNRYRSNRYLKIWLVVTAVSFSLFLLSARATLAQDVEPTPEPPPEVKQCAECHLNVTAHWQDSPHAHAFDDPVFQEWWQGRDQPGECLLCHTTGYQASTGEYVAEGIQCEACHGEANPDHPPAVAPLRADTEYCGVCHTPTLSEWRVTGHAHRDVGCTDCHDPHNQQPLFAEPDDLCINCHQDDMGDYLEDTHIQQGIGCVDCHMLVIPPEVMPEDGLVPTGHQFAITPATCVACHTDTLHAGFSLPGYEAGASRALTTTERITTTLTLPERPYAETLLNGNGAALSQQVQILEAALASRNLTILFQGGVVGLALGGVTAWVVAHNVRRRSEYEAQFELEEEPQL